MRMAPDRRRACRHHASHAAPRLHSDGRADHGRADAGRRAPELVVGADWPRSYRTLAVYFLFTRLLGTALPRGLLGFLRAERWTSFRACCTASRHPRAEQPPLLLSRLPRRHSDRRAAGRGTARRPVGAAAGDVRAAAGRRRRHARPASSTGPCTAARPRRSWSIFPGEAASVVTCLDGHAMARQGRAGAALGHCCHRLVHRRNAERRRADAVLAASDVRRVEVRSARELRGHRCSGSWPPYSWCRARRRRASSSWRSACSAPASASTRSTARTGSRSASST